MPEPHSAKKDTPAPLQLSHQVRTFETDARGRLTASALLNILQYTAGKHADMLGWSVRGLQEQGKTWVLQRFYCDIRSLPSDDEIIHITTYPSDADKLLAYRDYKVENESGDIIVKATSSWVILNLESRRVEPVPAHVAGLSGTFGPRIIRFRDRRLKAFSPELAENAADFRIRKHDLDLNRHVNNVRYMEWGLESVPDSVFDTQQLRELDIVFKAECFFGDVVRAFSRAISSEEGYCFEHLLQRSSDSRIVCLMRSRWHDL
jgi:acyl-ACP thioesterase